MAIATVGAVVLPVVGRGLGGEVGFPPVSTLTAVDTARTEPSGATPTTSIRCSPLAVLGITTVTFTSPTPSAVVDARRTGVDRKKTSALLFGRNPLATTSTDPPGDGVGSETEIPSLEYGPAAATAGRSTSATHASTMDRKIILMTSSSAPPDGLARRNPRHGMVTA